VVKNIIKLNVQGVPIEIEDCLPTKEENKERRDVLVAVRKGTFTPKDKKKAACKAKALTTINTG
jgi:hypothetical protein